MHHSHLKCFLCVVLSVVALWLMALSNLNAQTTEGKEFWLVFQKNFRDWVLDDMTDEPRPAEPLKLHVTITARQDAKGYIESPFLKLHQSFTVRGGEVITIQVDSALQVTGSETIEQKSLHIVADVPISVYGGSHRYQTTDTYLGLPVESLGLTYRAMGYKWLADDLLSQFAVTATQDSTVVVITPSVKTQGGKPARIPFTILLNKGEVYQVIPSFDPTREEDLTGSLIVAGKPVALFSGHNCAYVPERAWKACNLLVEQLPSVDSWGKEFVIAPFVGRSSSVIRVLAHQDETEVFMNGTSVAVLNAGEFYEDPMVVNPTMIKATHPVLLAQFAKGFSTPKPESESGREMDSVGDPMMILIPPTDQYLNSYRFGTPYSGSWEHYVAVMATKEGMRRIRLDGKPVPPENFRSVAGTNYFVAGLQVEEGSHVLEGKEEFGLYSYGFGVGDKIFDAYGNNCGQGLTRWMAESPATPAISQKENQQKPKEVKEEKKEEKTPTTTVPELPVRTNPAPVKINNNKPKIESRDE